MTLYQKDGEDGGSEARDDAPAKPERPVLAQDTRLGERYVVVRRLGVGGMGAVYQVHDEHLDEAVALKLLHPDLSSDVGYRSRLRGEVRLARRVSHPNVCRVHDLGQHDGQLFVTMELIHGPSLRQNLRDLRDGCGAPIALARKIDILVQVCSALSAAHHAGVLHRDVKPDNVIVEDERAVLTDFGVASLAAELAAQRRLIAGTPAYIAPEVLRGEEYDRRVDVYATAVLAYELLAGMQPFRTPNLDAAVRRARTRPNPPRLPMGCASDPVREALDRVLIRGMCNDQDGRTPSVDRLAEALATAFRANDIGPTSFATPTPRPLETDFIDGDSPAPGPSPQAPPQAPTVVEQAPQPQPRAPTTSRSQLRVVTALHFRCEDGVVGQSDETLHDRTVETRPMLLVSVADRLERAVVDLGGTPLNVTENELVALFGAPVALGDDAARAARAARALVESTTGGRAGIDTARILYRQHTGGPPTASGDALHTASKLMAGAAHGEVRLSASSARQLAGRFRIDEVTSAPGDGPERVLLLDPRTMESEGETEDRPFVGRDAELERLGHLINEVCEQRTPRAAAVIAPAGLGKSRLRLELMRRLDERREIDWIVGRTAPLGEVAPLALLRNADPEWFAAASADGNQNGPGAFAAARRWLERRAARRPVAVLFEDMQWADDASRAFVKLLRRTLEQVPIAIVTFSRPTAEAEGELGDTIVHLRPLSDLAATAIARQVAPAASHEELADLVSRAGGNPFFIEELARDLRERGPAQVTQVTPLPATVEAVVQARLDRLPEAAQQVACAAAVVGHEFWREAAKCALADPHRVSDRELDEILAELERRSIVAALPPTTFDDDRYAFNSALVRDVAYQHLQPRERRRAHGAIARWLELRAGGLTSKDPTMLSAIALHRDMAGDAKEARAAYRAAGKLSLHLFAYREAAAALRRAKALNDRPDSELLELLGDALIVAESIDAAEPVFRAALDTANEDDPLRRAALWHKLGKCASELADNDAAIRCYERGLAIAAPGGELISAARADPTVAARLYGALGWTLGYQLDDNERGLPYSERAVALLEGTGLQRELAKALSRLGGNYMRAGRFLDQLECNQRNLSIGEELGDLEMQKTAHINLGVTHTTQGNIDAAIDHTRKALALCAKTGAVTTMPLVRNNLAGMLLEKGETAEASGQLAEAIRLGQKLGNRRFLPEAYGFAARLAVVAGDLDGAITNANQAVAIAEGAGMTVDEGIARRILGAIQARSGDHAGATGSFTRSRECLATRDPYELARTQAAEARFWRSRGDDELAAELRSEAAAAFRRLGAKLELELLDDPHAVR